MTHKGKHNSHVTGMRYHSDPDVEKKAVALYQSGLGNLSIGVRLNITQKNLDLILAKHGVKRRSIFYHEA